MNNIIIVTQKKDVNGIKAVEIFKQREFSNYRMIYVDDMNDYLDINNPTDIEFIKNSSIWLRRPDLFEYQIYGSIGHITDYDERQKNFMELMYKFNQRLNYINHYVTLSRKTLQADRDAAMKKDKLFHLELAKELGFIVPEYIYTNKVKEMEEFLEKKGKTITKNIGKPLKDKDYLAFLGTTEVTLDILAKIEVEEMDYPVFFQKFIESDYEFRVTVVGERIYASKLTKLDKSVMDIRVAEDANNVKHTNISLPIDVQNKILMFMERLKINYGCFDFLFANDKYVFLEVNPSGQYMWIEEKSNLNITEGIIDYLLV